MCNIISAGGNTIPPAFVFPRVNFKDFMLSKAPVGSLGLAYQTGWMTNGNFLLVVKHHIKHVKPSKEEPILVIMDNHETHITIDVVLEARNNRANLLTMPPHCSHRLQPLDVAGYAPFKSHYYSAANNWMLNNPGRTLTIYNLAEIAGIPFNNTMSRKNIRSGFEKTGIYPFNDEIFTDGDFLGSAVTDRPMPEPSTSVGVSVPSTSTALPQIETTPSRSTTGFILPPVITLEDVLSFPKAQPRKGQGKGRTLTVTSTPEKDALLYKSLEKEKKLAIQKAVKRKLIDYDSETSEEDLAMEYQEMSNELEEMEPDFNFSTEQIEKNNFVLVKFELKKSVVHYVGQVDEVTKDHEFEVNFLRRQTNKFNFNFPEKTDKCTVPLTDILLRLPAPTYIGGTQRAVANLKFSVDLTKV